MEKKTFFKRLFCALGAFVLGFAAVILPTISTINSYASSFDTTYDDSLLDISWKTYENRYYNTGNTFEMAENRLFQFGANSPLYYFGTTVLYSTGGSEDFFINNDFILWYNLGSHGFSEVPSYNWSTITIGNSVFLYKKDYSSSTYNKVYLVSIDYNSLTTAPVFTEITVSNLPTTAYANTSFGSQLWVYNNVVYFNLDYIVTFDGSSFNFQNTNFFNVYPEQNNLNMQYRFVSENNNYYYDGSNAYKLNYYNNTFESINISFAVNIGTYNIDYISFDGLFTYYLSLDTPFLIFDSNTNTFKPIHFLLLFNDVKCFPKAVTRSLFIGVADGKLSIYCKSLGNEYYYLGYNQGYTNGYNAGYSAGIANTDNNAAYESGYNSGYNAGLSTNSGYAAGYDSGYAIGYREGKLVGSNEGYNNGYNAGSSDGYDLGYNAGVETGSDYSFLSLIGAVIDAPIQAFTGLFNFEIFGTNIKNLLLALFTASIIVVIIKFALGGK